MKKDVVEPYQENATRDSPSTFKNRVVYAEYHHVTEGKNCSERQSFQQEGTHVHRGIEETDIPGVRLLSIIFDGLW